MNNADIFFIPVNYVYYKFILKINVKVESVLSICFLKGCLIKIHLKNKKDKVEWRGDDSGAGESPGLFIYVLGVLLGYFK